MIFGNLKNREKYYPLHPLFKRAFEGLELNESPAAGAAPDSGADEIRYFPQSYLTRSDNLSFEDHKKYIDIQVILEGKERIYVGSPGELAEIFPYDEKKDAAFYGYDPGCGFRDLSEGDFLILFPGEAHCPRAMSGEASNVRKTVVKVLFRQE